MAWGMISHRVHDYDKWKVVFEENAAVRKEFGCTGGYVFRDADDPNKVTALLEFESVERFRAFRQDPRLADAMSRAGVDGPPDIRALEVAERPEY